MAMRRTKRTIGAVTAAALVVAACSDDAEEPAASPETVAPTTTVVTTTTDGQLHVGVLLPTSGTAGSLLGDGMVTEVRQARSAINAAGGVLGRPLRLTEADEGESVSSAQAALDTLLEAGVDAVIGPGSSLAALGILESIRSAGVVACSPTASTLAVDTFPDEGRFVRTIPSDSLAMAALAQTAEGTGARTVAVAYLDDRYGRGLRDATVSALANRPIQLIEQVGFRGDDTSLLDEAVTLLGSDPAVVLVLADAVGAAQMLAALAETEQATTNATAAPIVVNETLRDPSVQTVLAALPSRFRDRITGVGPLPAPEPADGEPTPAPFAAMAGDCLNLIALAAVQAGTDDPLLLAPEVSQVSVNGLVCRTFETCNDRIGEGLQVDYAGQSGNTDISASTGDPITARFERFGIGDDGASVSLGSFTVSR
jgi:branched-chain amino acid transport system substrate-binding protein